MYENDTSRPAFTATTENILNNQLDSQREPGLYSIISNEVVCDPTISGSAFKVYAIIAGYCGASGVCFISQKALEQKCPWLTKDIMKKATNQLVEKGFLFRRRIPSQFHGSSRELVVKCHWEKYFKRKWQERDLQCCAEVESYFTYVEPEFLLNQYKEKLEMQRQKSLPKVEKFFEKKSSTESNSKKDLNGAKMTPSNGAKTAPSIYKEEKKELEETTTILQGDKKAGSANSDFVVVVISELKKAGIPKEQVEMAVRYIAKNQKILAKKENPVGYILNGLRSGWLKDEMKETMEADRHANEAACELEANRKRAKEVVSELQGRSEDVDVNMNENSVRFDFRSGRLKGQTVILGWKDRGFKKKLKSMKEQADVCIRNTRTASSMEKSRS